MASQFRRITSGQIQVGQALLYSLYDERGRLLLPRGKTVLTERQLASLTPLGLQHDVAEVHAVNQGQLPASPPWHPTHFDLAEQSLWRLELLLRSVDREADFSARCDVFATQLMSLVLRDADMSIFLAVRQDKRRVALYGLTHSLRTALLCQLMATRLAWPEPRVRTLVKAALTMNLSIIDLQGEFAGLGRLSDEQTAQIHAHPEQAVQALQAAGVTDADWLEAVLHHHERPGGEGYPHKQQVLSEMADALRLCDVFMAKISPRGTRAPLPVQEAARQMFNETRGSAAATAIVKEFGIYPPGDFVELASGELAVVIRRGATPLTPLVAAITDRAGLSITRYVRRDTAHATYQIKGLATDTGQLLRLQPDQLYSG